MQAENNNSYMYQGSTWNVNDNNCTFVLANKEHKITSKRPELELSEVDILDKMEVAVVTEKKENKIPLY